eukprot:Gb_13261 [translate_table: standard]
MPLLVILDNSTLFSSWSTVFVVGLSLMICVCAAVMRWVASGGQAWSNKGNTIPGPIGWPIVGSLLEMGGLAHRRLASLAVRHGATPLMAFSLGSNRGVITCQPDVARHLLSSTDFADRPLKESAKLLLFGRAIGFAPYGDYLRNLRRIAATHLFSPKRIAAHEQFRQTETSEMLQSLWENASSVLNSTHVVRVRPFLQRAALNNIMMTVFGRRYDFNGSGENEEAVQLQEMVSEGFELLGAFNWADYVPLFKYFHIHGRIHQRCAKLVSQVKVFVQSIIDEHRLNSASTWAVTNSSDFVDVLISLQMDEKISDADMIAILWVMLNVALRSTSILSIYCKYFCVVYIVIFTLIVTMSAVYMLQEMIFRGSDTMAILTEWALAELVLHPVTQSKLHAELDAVVGRVRRVSDADIPKLPYLQAIVKETLRLHPPGPLLSWARLSTKDTVVAGHSIPRGTTAMVNMWAITHDESIWSEPYKFIPERFMASEGGDDVDIRGNDLRLAPFGSGRRVCPGRALGVATVHLWVARLLHHFTWVESPGQSVDLSEVLKLSCQMVSPLSAKPLKRIDLPF